MPTKTKKSAKGDVASWLSSIGWVLTHEDPGSEGEVDLDQLKVGRNVRTGQRDASFSARNTKTGHDLNLPSLQRLLDAVNEYEAVQRPV